MGRIKWEYANSTDKDYIFELAITKGWAENKVQVRVFRGRPFRYTIEPYDDCTCPNVLRYDDYYIDGVRV